MNGELDTTEIAHTSYAYAAPLSRARAVAVAACRVLAATVAAWGCPCGMRAAGYVVASCAMACVSPRIVPASPEPSELLSFHETGRGPLITSVNAALVPGARYEVVDEDGWIADVVIMRRDDPGVCYDDCGYDFQAEYAASSHRRAGRHAIAFGPIAQRRPHARATPTLGAAAWPTDKLGVLFEELPGMDGWIAVPPAVDLDGDGQGDLALFVRPRCNDAPLARDCYEVRRRDGTRIELVHAYRWSSVLQL